MPPRDVIETELLTLLSDYRDLNSSPITVQSIPTAVEFAKQVSKGYPAIYQAYTKVSKTIDNRGVFSTKNEDDDDAQVKCTVDPSLLEYPAFTWTKQDLINLIEGEVEVAVTPDGRADDIYHVNGQDEPVFLAPATVMMSIEDLLKRLSGSGPARNMPSSSLSFSSQQTQAKSESGNGHSNGSKHYEHATNDKYKHPHLPNPIFYLQSQNNNTVTHPSLSRLLSTSQIPSNFPFAETVLSSPEAINIWIGDDRSITSTHRDPYENLYLVLKGQKVFTLFPPVDEIVLPSRMVRTGRHVYHAEDGRFEVELDEDVEGSHDVDADANAHGNDPGGEGEGEDEDDEKNHANDSGPPRIPWITLNPLLPHSQLLAQHPLYAHASPRTVTVSEGQILYLPSGWYHHVQQECGVWDDQWPEISEEEDGGGERGRGGSRETAPCIAVNYWFDMEYEGEKYVMRQLVGRLKRLLAEMGEDE